MSAGLAVAALSLCAAVWLAPGEAAPAGRPWTATQCSVIAASDYSGSDLPDNGRLITETLDECQVECIREPKCFFYTFKPHTEHCYLKSAGAGASLTPDDDYVTGNCTGIDPAVTYSPPTPPPPRFTWAVPIGRRGPFAKLPAGKAARCIRMNDTAVKGSVGGSSPSYPSLPIAANSIDLCADLCDGDPACKGWTATKPYPRATSYNCMLMTSWESGHARSGTTFGTKCEHIELARVGACACRLSPVNRSIAVRAHTVFLAQRAAASDSLSATDAALARPELVFAGLLWATLFFNRCPYCQLTSPTPGFEGRKYRDPLTLPDAKTVVPRMGLLDPPLRRFVSVYRSGDGDIADTALWTEVEEKAFAQLPHWAVPGADGLGDDAVGLDGVPVAWRVASLSDTGGTAEEPAEGAAGSPAGLGSIGEEGQRDHRSFSFRALSRCQTCHLELKQVFEHYRIDVTNGAVARACFEMIRDHKLDEIDPGQTACAPMGGQGPGPKTQLAFLGYPKSGTSVFMMLVWTALFHDACPHCPLSIPATDTHIRHSVSMAVLDWQLADTVVKPEWPAVEQLVWQRTPLFTHALTGHWLKEVLPESTWMEFLRGLFTDDDTTYYATSLFRERKKLTRSAHGYFGSNNIRYYGPNWDSWIKSIINLRKPNVNHRMFSFDRLVKCATCPGELTAVMEHYRLPVSQDAIERACFEANARTLHPVISKKLESMVHPKRDASLKCNAL